MPNHLDPDWLLGRTYISKFKVLSIDDDEARTVKLLLLGDTYQISFDELQTIIERGLVWEIAEHQ